MIVFLFNLSNPQVLSPEVLLKGHISSAVYYLYDNILFNLKIIHILFIVDAARIGKQYN